MTLRLLVAGLSLGALVLLQGGCAARGGDGPIVDMRGVDPFQYRNDLADCEQYADQVRVGGKAGTGVAVGAVLGGLIGAAVGNSGTAQRTAGAGAVAGGASGVGDGLRERRMVVRNCLRQRGYAVLN